MTSAILLGHRGFVGSAIEQCLKGTGVDVIGVTRSSYESIRGASADFLINASGSSDRRLADQDPISAFRANVSATFESIFDFTYQTYVLLSSTSVYGGSAQTTHEDAEIEPTLLPRYAFQKYLAELVVRAAVPRWVIFRLGPLVGTGLRKNAIFDLLNARRLYVHPDSEVSYLDTRTAADAIWRLRNHHGEIYNLCGTGAVRLADVAEELGVQLGEGSGSLPRDDSRIDNAKVNRLIEMPPSADAVKSFIEEHRRFTTVD